MKTNGDVLREKLSKMSDEELSKYGGVCDLICNLVKENFYQHYCGKEEDCRICKKNFLSLPYEDGKRWYLYRYSSKRGKEIYISNWETNAVRKNEQFTETKEYKKLFTFEEACEIRIFLNITRQHKKNLWNIAEVKENE